MTSRSSPSTQTARTTRKFRAAVESFTRSSQRGDPRSQTRAGQPGTGSALKSGQHRALKDPLTVGLRGDSSCLSPSLRGDSPGARKVPGALPTNTAPLPFRLFLFPCLPFLPPHRTPCGAASPRSAAPRRAPRQLSGRFGRLGPCPARLPRPRRGSSSAAVRAGPARARLGSVGGAGRPRREGSAAAPRREHGSAGGGGGSVRGCRSRAGTAAGAAGEGRGGKSQS